MHGVPTENLWLGHVGDTWDLGTVLDAGVEAVIDLALNEPPARVTRELVYCRIPLVDGTGNPPWLLRTAVEVTVSLLRAGTPTLLYCSAGMSRTPAVAAAAVAVLRNKDPEACLRELTRSRPSDVSPGLWRDLLAALNGW